MLDVLVSGSGERPSSPQAAGDGELAVVLGDWRINHPQTEQIMQVVVRPVSSPEGGHGAATMSEGAAPSGKKIIFSGERGYDM
jgi:hypothetical protein